MSRKRRIMKRIVIVLLCVFAVFSVCSIIAVTQIFRDIFARTEVPEYYAYLRYDDVADEYDRELISFPSGENMLQGYLYGAENTKGLVVICHGIGGGADSYFPESLYFVEHGYQVFAFDNTGCHRSEGENMVGLCQSVLDLDAALTYLESQPRFDDLPVLLYGHSWGGYAVTAIFNFDHDIAASASVAGFNKQMPVILEWGKDMMGGLVYLEYPYIWVYQQAYFGANANWNAVDGINRTDTPVLIIHGTEDTSVGYDGAGIIAYRDEITNPNVQYKICDQAPQNDHSHLFASLDAIAYEEQLNGELEELKASYDDEIPDDVIADFYDRVDKQKLSELDAQFMEDVLNFYEQVLQTQ